MNSPSPSNIKKKFVTFVMIVDFKDECLITETVKKKKKICASGLKDNEEWERSNRTMTEKGCWKRERKKKQKSTDTSLRRDAMAAVDLAVMHRENPAARVTAVVDDDEDQYHWEVTAAKVNVVSSLVMKTQRPEVPLNRATRHQRTRENCKGKSCPGHRPCPLRAWPRRDEDHRDRPEVAFSSRSGVLAA